jgi:hypothetical protein
VNVLGRDPSDDFDPINDASQLFALLREWVRLGGGWKLVHGPQGFEALAWKIVADKPIRHSMTEPGNPAVAIMRCILMVLAEGAE